MEHVGFSYISVVLKCGLHFEDQLKKLLHIQIRDQLNQSLGVGVGAQLKNVKLPVTNTLN